MGIPQLEQDTPVRKLTRLERDTLLNLARQAIEVSLQALPIPALDLDRLSVVMRKPGATFVTLTIAGELRGCVGGLEATLPLVEDARTHAVAAALNDYRFHPLVLAELPRVCIEISCLSVLRPISYHCPEDLLEALSPGLDGVVVRAGIRRATFLPQVWVKIPDKAEFLGLLCKKLGYSPDLWRYGQLEVLTYQVESFHE